MKLKGMIHKYFRRLVIEAIIKSFTMGLLIGSMIALIVKISSWFNYTDLTFLSIMVGLGATLISSGLFYLLKFRPNLKQVASRVDGLGLDERMITMLDMESKNVVSYIAQKQRNDAVEKLSKVHVKQLKFKLLSLPTFVLLFLVPITVGSMAISVTSSNSTDPSSDSSSEIPTEEEKEMSAEIEKIRSIIRKADINNDQKNDLYEMVDELVSRIKFYQTSAEKTSDIKRTKDIVIEKIEDFIIANLLDVIHDLIDDAEVKKPFKVTLHQKVYDFQDEVKKVSGLNSKMTKVQEFVGDLQEEIILEAVAELRDIVANAEVGQEIKDIANGMIDDLEDRIANVHQTYIEKMVDIKKTKEEIIKLLIPPPQDGEEPKPGPSTTTDELDELGTDMQDAVDNALQDLEDLKEYKDEEELEGQLPDESEEEGDGEEGDKEESNLPPPPKDGEIHDDYIIDGVTPYLPELEKKIPGITDILAQGDIPQDIKKMIESYLELIIKNQGKQN